MNVSFVLPVTNKHFSTTAPANNVFIILFVRVFIKSLSVIISALPGFRESDQAFILYLFYFFV